jgi:mycothiol synthase
MRPPVLADADEVLRVLHARETADVGAPEVTAGDVLDQWQASTFDLARDAVLAVDPSGAVTGYAMLWALAALVVVDPRREGEGVGSALLAWAEQLARESGRPVHRQLVAGRNAAGHDLLERAGYRQVRSYWRLARALDPAPQVPTPPSGVSIAPIELDADAHALSAAAEAAFAGSADYERESFRALLEQLLGAHDFDPALGRVARRNATIIGFALCRRWTEHDAGHIGLLGVDGSERGRGLGTTLLLSAFAAFAAAGLREAYLEVASDNADALRLYEGVGMTERHRLDAFEKPI